MPKRALSRLRVAEAPAPVDTGAQRDLSPRQHQILAMLRAGKVNKEIARELGIGLGTVKQHVVALFKKLDVSNRTMAVSRGIQMQSATRPSGVAALTSEGMLEYRPCVVLSFALAETLPEELGRKVQQILAAYAFDHDALFLARKGHAGDLIFGIQRATEQDLYLALRAARTVTAELPTHEGEACGLRAALTAGLAIASMHRTGGWTGEAIASIAIAECREIANTATPGTLKIAQAARELLRVLNPNSPAYAIDSLPLSSLADLPWQIDDEELAPIGRDEELRKIDELLASPPSEKGVLLQITGETGMGKSRLCRYAVRRARDIGANVHHFVCRPDGERAAPYVSASGETLPGNAVYECLARDAGEKAEIIVVDDCHFLPQEEFKRLALQASAARRKLVLLAARRFPATDIVPSHAIRLGRLDAQSIEKLVVSTLGRASTVAKIASVIRRAAGGPLFAIELARQHKPDLLPLSLRILIGARIDGIKLDRTLLRKLARSRTTMDCASLARELNEPPASVQAAVKFTLASGVLQEDRLGKLRFTHPLIRQAIDIAGVE
jgi:DNA-binding CsgD family transcriptional regulator